MPRAPPSGHYIKNKGKNLHEILLKEKVHPNMKIIIMLLIYI